ncbi:MAG TPA: HupE/UreJ family protein [Polyangiaceae bacterium]|jgi:hydrogenase/urease accessory protein HupE
MTRVKASWLRRAVVAMAALGLATLVSERHAFAHAVGVSSGEYRVADKVLSGDVGMAGRDFVRWLPAIDTNHDGAIDPDELSAGHDILARALSDGLTVQGDGKVCLGSLDRAWLLEDEGGVVFQVHYTCPDLPARLTLAMPMLDALAPGHRHLARVFRAGKPQVKVLDQAHPRWDLADANVAASNATPAENLGWSMLKLGVEHILTGADHLVFLLGLILVGGRFRSLVGVVSAFTLAHSITLALAALSVFAPSPRIVEPAIALSIAYVGVENLFVKDASKRWRITFPFGLIHGFGFAGALREIALPRAQLPIALVSFNLGVELGQLAVLSLVLPLTQLARGAPWFGSRGVKLSSVAIALGGCALFVSRLVTS